MRATAHVCRYRIVLTSFFPFRHHQHLPFCFDGQGYHSSNPYGGYDQGYNGRSAYDGGYHSGASGGWGGDSYGNGHWVTNWLRSDGEGGWVRNVE